MVLKGLKFSGGRVLRQAKLREKKSTSGSVPLSLSLSLSPSQVLYSYPKGSSLIRLLPPPPVISLACAPLLHLPLPVFSEVVMLWKLRPPPLFAATKPS
ncbi:hypothetical protein E2C01_066258 [Portunus trituberculatus]|uniref:Uncharacterized protein n=1 Tax=Portunus trituberculatus TaxID=210409 RepID=A0A5B7HPS9_PORTR|nr:hypothetical protein [Portunus trituberculatus]